MSEEVPESQKRPIDKARAETLAKWIRVIVLGLVVLGVTGVVFYLFVGWVNPSMPDERLGSLSTFAQVVGGLGLFGSLFFTYQNLKNSKEALKVSQETLNNSIQSLAVERRSKESERFFKAVELLGTSESVGVRLSAIHALGALARDSVDDREQSYEVIISYLRLQTYNLHQSNIEAPSPDVQAAIDVLAHRKPNVDGSGLGQLDFSHLTLKNVNFRAGWFSHCNFIEAELNGSNFTGCMLSDTVFAEALCHHCHFEGATLWLANFSNAELQGATFYDPVGGVREEGFDDLEAKVYLWHCGNSEVISGSERRGQWGERLRLLVLREANIEGVKLFATNLNEAIGLKQEQLDTALYDESTILPKGLVHNKRRKPDSPNESQPDTSGESGSNHV